MKMEGVHPRRKDEREYEREMRRLYLRPYLDGLAAALREARPNSTSAWLAVVAAHTAIFEREMAVRFPREVIERWASRVNAYHANAFIRTFARAGKVDIRPWMNAENSRRLLIDVVERNVSLIRSIPNRFETGLAEKVARAEMAAPMDLAQREKIYRKEGVNAGYNLRRIVRDQNSKLNGELSRIRQQDAGVTAYRWQTSKDDRVRPTHRENDGKIFSWGIAPAQTGHPGNDIQCRCVAIAHITEDMIEQMFGA